MEKSRKQLLINKAKRFGENLLRWAPVVIAGMTCWKAFAADDRSRSNARKIKVLQHNQGVIKEAVNHNAIVEANIIDHVNDLEKNNQKLLDEAIGITEGKEETAA